jgi:uncharacterized protein (TIGR02265 family)
LRARDKIVILIFDEAHASLMDEVVDKKLKGVIYIGYSNYIKKKWGLDALQQCSKAVGLDLTKLVEEKWYPDANSALIIHWVASTYGREYLRQMGQSTVTERGIISVMARLAGMRKILESAQKELRDTINFGEASVEFNERGAVMKLSGLVTSDVECEVWTGVFEGMMKISGAKGTVKKVACQAKGDAACAYELVWK